MLDKPITKIAPKTWMITDYHLDNYYVVEGSESAAMIDTGIGMGNMLEEVRSVTDKPLHVFLTHGHPDHCGGVYAFDTVPYMSPIDEEIAKVFYEKYPEYRTEYVKSRAALRNPELQAQLVLEVPEKVSTQLRFQPLQEGDLFDLGDRSLEVINSPGHSSGCVSFLDKKERILFSGDIVGDSVLLFGRSTIEEEVEVHKRLFYNNHKTENTPVDDNTECLQRFLEGLKKLWSREKEFDYLAVGHGKPLREKNMILGYIHIAEKLLNGEAKGTYEETSIRRGWVYKENGLELWYKCEM